MEINYIIGYFLALLVGVSLGLIGSGGSILSLPILVYIMRVEPVLATAYSLFIVGITALVGGFKKVNEQLVDFKKAILFGIPTVIVVFITRIFIMPSIPNTIKITTGLFIQKSAVIMIFFAIVMLFASMSMIRKSKEITVVSKAKLNYPVLISQGIFIGFIAGFVGAGGGFLIIPALLYFAKTPIKMAVGTSFFIIASQSLIGFLADLQVKNVIDWQLLLLFTSISITGFFIGNAIAKKMSGEKLKLVFGYFVLLMGVFILVKEIFYSQS